MQSHKPKSGAVRAELHTDYLLPDGRRPVAGAVLVSPSGQVLLQHRDDIPEIESPGQWSLFGGGLDTSEDPAECMLREVDEEIGYRPTAYRPLIVFSGWRAEYHIYLAEVTPPIEQLTLTEGQGFAFFNFDDALRLDLTEVARLALEALQMLQLQRDQKAGGSLLSSFSI